MKIPRIHKIHITKKEVEVFLNDDHVHVYENNPKRLAWLSKVPGYYVSTLEELGYGFSASILRKKQ